MFTHVNLATSHHVNRCDMPHAIATERDLAGTVRLGNEDLHPGDHPLEGALHRADGDLQ
jgi:hypothetical protein